MHFGSLTARTVAALTLLAVVVGFMFAVILDNTRAEKDAAAGSRRAEDRVAVLSGEQRLLVDVETGIRGWLITGERRFLQPFEAARTALPAAEARLLALEEDPADRREVRYMHGAINAYLREYAIPLATAAPPGSRAERSLVTADGKERMDRLRLLVADYARGETAESDARAAAARRHARHMTEVAAGGLSVSVLLVLLVAIYQLRWVLAPVRRVGTAARRIAMGDLVLEEDGVDPGTRRFLEVVDRNAGRLLRLVGDLLFVAQVEAGELSLDPGPVDFGTVCAESVEAARPRAVEAQVELVLDAERVRPLHGDSGRLGQAVDNLVSNAIKFTPPGGRVEVVLRESGDDVVVEVSDTGVGIPAAEQGRLFDRFSRSQAAGEQAVPGVGLGLTIVKAIVDGHGGEVAVSSEEGRGTTFRVRVPRAPADVNFSLTQGTPTEVRQ